MMKSVVVGMLCLLVIATLVASKPKNKKPKGPKAEIRLANGPDESKGRVEIYHDGEWGTVCLDLFQKDEAIVLCRSLGYRYGRMVFTAYYGEGSGPVWLDNVRCRGEESDILQCDNDGWGQTDCGHDRDVGVQCSNDGFPKEPPAEMRLVNGPSEAAGRLEVLHNGAWGSVCDFRFNQEEAHVVCKALGYSFGTYKRGAFYGQTSDPRWLSFTECDGSEPSISHCKHFPWGEQNCHDWQTVGVECSNEPNGEDEYEFHGDEEYELPSKGFEGDLQLVGGPNTKSGRLEIWHDGVWGTVCDDEFGEKEALVACSALGYRYAKLVPSKYFGLQSKRIWLDNVICYSGEESLSECGHEPWGKHDCYHSEDVGLECSNEVISNPSEGEMALVNGQDAAEGRLEIFHNGEWGTVCADGFWPFEAVVVCRSKGYRYFKFELSTYNYGVGVGKVWLSNLDCDGEEKTLADCKHSGWAGNDCPHTKDIGLKCSQEPFLEEGPAEMRLVNGTSEASGRVEILHNGRWGTVCDFHGHFRASEAQVVCNGLGYSYSRVHLAGFYGAGTGPIWMDMVGCDGHEQSLSECRLYSEWGEAGCEHSQDAAVECSNVPWTTPTPATTTTTESQSEESEEYIDFESGDDGESGSGSGYGYW